MGSPPTLHPTSSSERIQALDFLRGVAILGILIMNIQYFSMPTAAYMNPTVYGDLTGINKWVWILSHLFADQKFMTIFSILFGAGIVLVTQRAEDRTGRSKGLHYRRTLWLLLIGLIHAHLIWHGDILVSYALCALLAYLFRKKSPRTLMIIGTIVVMIPVLMYLGSGYSMQYWPAESIEQALKGWNPSQDIIDEEIAALTGTWLESIKFGSMKAFGLETFVFLIFTFWRAGGLMLIGMALYKMGVLTAKRMGSWYLKRMLIAYGIGFTLVIIGIVNNWQAGFSFEYSMFYGSLFNYTGSLLVGFGHICLVMLIAKSNTLKWLKDRLAAVGQMALTNYIAQSVICTTIFYGFGFGLFGSVERIGQVGIVLAVWLVIFLWSRPWLDRFRFGPLEWMWSTLR